MVKNLPSFCFEKQFIIKIVIVLQYINEVGVI